MTLKKPDIPTLTPRTHDYSADAQIHSGQTEAGSAEEVAPPHSAGQMLLHPRHLRTRP